MLRNYHDYTTQIIRRYHVINMRDVQNVKREFYLRNCLIELTHLTCCIFKRVQYGFE